MTKITGSPVLTLLRRKRLLKSRLRWLGLHDEQTAQWLLDLDNQSSASSTTAPPASVLETLRQNRLVCSTPLDPAQSAAPDRRHRPSLAFVDAVNLELTYDCNWDCGHCLQQGVRKRCNGGVRTCLYAPGGGWLANVNREPLLDIINHFAENPVTAAFSSGKIEAMAEVLITPYAHLYRSVGHSCAALAVLARVIESATLSDPSLREVHEPIASDLNLHAE